MNNKDISTIKALSRKLHDNPDEAFFAKKTIDQVFLRWPAIENLLNDFYRISEDTIELIDSSVQQKIPLKKFIASWMSVERPDPNFIFDKINNEGHSLVILGASRLNSEINQMCSLMEEYIPRAAVDVHVYCGLQGSKSFKAHYDKADNLIVHQSGKCYWKVYKQKSSDCNYEFNIDGNNLDVQFETEIETGDLIYVPMHQYHECIPLEKRISLSIPIIKHLNRIDRSWYMIG